MMGAGFTDLRLFGVTEWASYHLSVFFFFFP